MDRTILFYSSVPSKNLFNTQQFYRIDIDLLTQLGYKVVLSNSIFDSLKFWKYSILFAYFYRYSFFSALLARCLGKRVYFTGGIDDLDKNYASRRRYIVQRYFYILCYWVSNSCIIVSQADMKNVLRVLAKKGKLTFSEHTIEIDKFVINAFEEKDKLFSTIVWMGNENNVKRKGVDRALKVFSHLKKYKQFEDYKFIIIGKKGEGTAYLLDLINKYMLSESVYFTDEISEEEKINFLKRSKYYFQLSEYEGFGLAALEALASKNIVIHSAKGGLTNPIFSAGIHFNIDENPDIECENLFNQLLNYDNSKLTETTQVIKCYYNNTRRKHDFEKILND